MNKSLNILAIACMMAIAIGCRDHADAGKSEHRMDSGMAMSPEPSAALKGLAFAYPKDPSCGMPLSAGLEDSTLYKGKIYGFCSKECKDAFLKDPATAVSTLK